MVDSRFLLQYVFSIDCYDLALSVFLNYSLNAHNV